VAIGGDQTAVYPFAMPGGWRIIGRTDRTMWDLGRVPPNLLGTGDRVRFVPVR
jgi:inhibitor of KinA